MELLSLFRHIIDTIQPPLQHNAWVMDGVTNHAAAFAAAIVQSQS